MFYLGTFFHTLDAKNRLFIPARFREHVGTEFVLFKSPDKCISIYDNETFEGLLKQVSTLTDTPEGRRQAKYLTHSAVTTLQDKQGRFTVPVDFIAYASLSTDVVITGEANHLEIWSKKAYDAQTAEMTNASADDYPRIRY